MKTPRRLQLLYRIDRLVEADPRPRSIIELRTQLRSKSRDIRLTALARIRKQIETSGLRQGYFNLAQALTLDTDSTCRWQATIIIGEFIEKYPGRVWRVARELGASRNKDIRAAASTVLLEHLLQYHPKKMLKLFREELKQGNSRFARAVAGCWNFGRGASEQQIEKVLEEARGEPIGRTSRRFSVNFLKTANSLREVATQSAHPIRSRRSS